jgi:hypothetical protein
MTKHEIKLTGLSPIERGETNVAKLRDYLNELRRSGRGVPVNNDGEPNRTAIAAECGFRRNVLHTNKAAILLLNEFLGRGAEKSAVGGLEADAAALAAQNGVLEQRIIRLEQRLAVVTVERDELRSQLARYKAIEEDVLKKGRRIIP